MVNSRSPYVFFYRSSFRNTAFTSRQFNKYLGWLSCDLRFLILSGIQTHDLHPICFNAFYEKSYLVTLCNLRNFCTSGHCWTHWILFARWHPFLITSSHFFQIISWAFTKTTSQACFSLTLQLPDSIEK